MLREDVINGRIVRAYFPYGSNRMLKPPAGTDDLWDAGTALVEDREGRRVEEAFSLERVGKHWGLRSKTPDGAWRCLALVHADQLPADPGDVAASLLTELWSLRLPRELRLVRALRFGGLGAMRWERIESHIGQRLDARQGFDETAGAHAPAALEQRLRAEGHVVCTLEGPVGTTEHLLLF